MLWHGVLYPRLLGLLPKNARALEIAPGFGRFTQYLKDLCHTLDIVDLTAECIEACRHRFESASNIRFHVNDGKSLGFLEDESIDFVFSFDSLVHVESSVMEAYVQELGRKLAPNGVGFLHHSNMGAFRDPETGELLFENRHWRGESMSAALFREFCNKSSLRCVGQELVNWGVPEPLTDCFSIIVRGDGPAETEIRENPNFMDEALALQAVRNFYRLD